MRKITAKYQKYCRIKTVIKNQEVDIMKRRKNILAWSVGHWYQDSPFLGLAVNDFCPEKRRSGSGG